MKKSFSLHKINHLDPDIDQTIHLFSSNDFRARGIVLKIFDSRPRISVCFLLGEFK